MNTIGYNNYDLTVFKDRDEVVVVATFYRYYKRVLRGEIGYRWRTSCPELMDKIENRRTKVFTGQLIQLARTYGVRTVVDYHVHGGVIYA